MSKDCDCNDCCSKVMQGVQGQQGVQGPRGQDGLQGPQGIQGVQGIPGTCVACDNGGVVPPFGSNAEFAEVYSKTDQNLAASAGPNMAGGIVKLENTVFNTANIDVSTSAADGKVVINKAGWYDIATGICGTLNPIASPLPVWTLSLFLNGVLVPGSTFANQTISPEQQSNEIVADVFVKCAVGDVLTLANTSSAPVLITSPVLGTNAQPSSAYMKISLLQAL